MIQLVKRSIAGDADAFLELMEKNSLAMYKVARGILDNDEDAADAMQDTILTCFEKIHTLKNPEESYRIILVLYYVEGFRIADIASILNMNENTVKTRLVRARVQLKQEYAPAENADLHEKTQQTKSGKLLKLTEEKSAGDRNGTLKTQTGTTRSIAISARKG